MSGEVTLQWKLKDVYAALGDLELDEHFSAEEIAGAKALCQDHHGGWVGILEREGFIRDARVHRLIKVLVFMLSTIASH